MWRYLGFGTICFVLGFLTHGELAEPVRVTCLPSLEALELRTRMEQLNGALLDTQGRQLKLMSLALELEESCGRRDLTSTTR